MDDTPKFRPMKMPHDVALLGSLRQNESRILRPDSTLFCRDR